MEVTEKKGSPEKLAFFGRLFPLSPFREALEIEPIIVLCGPSFAQPGTYVVIDESLK